MDDDTVRILKSEELFQEFLDLKRDKEQLKQQEANILREKEEIERVKCSVEYLKLLHEKSQLEAKQNDVEVENDASLKVHLYASQWQAHQLQDQLEMLNTVLSLSPYAFFLVDLKTMQITWASKNVKRLLGFSRSQLKSKKLKELFVPPEHDLVVKDNFVMAQPVIRGDQTKVWVDLSFQLQVSEEIEGALITCHPVTERYQSFNV